MCNRHGKRRRDSRRRKAGCESQSERTGSQINYGSNESRIRQYWYWLESRVWWVAGSNSVCVCACVYVCVCVCVCLSVGLLVCFSVCCVCVRVICLSVSLLSLSVSVSICVCVCLSVFLRPFFLFHLSFRMTLSVSHTSRWVTLNLNKLFQMKKIPPKT